MAATAPIGERELLGRRGRSDVRRCPPFFVRRNSGTTPGACTNKERRGHDRRRRNGPEENRVPKFRRLNNREIPVPRTWARVDRAPAAEQEMSPTLRRSRRIAPSLQACAEYTRMQHLPRRSVKQRTGHIPGLCSSRVCRSRTPNVRD